MKEEGYRQDGALNLGNYEGKEEANSLQEISLLLLSCDRYEDAWNPYFKLIHKNWENHPRNCYLMTEEKVFNCDFMEVKTINTDKKKTWTERLQYALKQIPSILV